MRTHSSILAWIVPWTEELGGLQSMGSQRVGHDLVTEQHVFLKVGRLSRSFCPSNLTRLSLLNSLEWIKIVFPSSNWHWLILKTQFKKVLLWEGFPDVFSPDMFPECPTCSSSPSYMCRPVIGLFSVPTMNRSLLEGGTQSASLLQFLAESRMPGT